jgi:hypothetical protein
LALALLREGYCSETQLLKWADANRFPFPLLRQVALELEAFEHDGKLTTATCGT